MKIYLLVPFLLVLTISGQNRQDPADDSPLQVLDFKWSPDHRDPDTQPAPPPTPMRAVIAENKNFQRKAREQRTPGAIDPNEHTVDGRSAAMDKAVQESRTVKPKRVDGYAYTARVKNLHTAEVEIVFWEYRFAERANPANVVRRQFLCAVKIKPDEIKVLQAFLIAGPSDTISADSLAKTSGAIFDEKVLVHRIEYTDGAIMQRKDWNFAELKPAIDRAVSTPWGTETCRGL